jgi:hypothetical protein
MIRFIIPLLLASVSCTLRAPHLAITTDPSGAEATVRCGDAIQRVITPASVRLPRSRTPCSLTLTKSDFETMTIQVPWVLPSASATHRVTAGDRPYIRPKGGGLWSPSPPEFAKPPDRGERPKLMHIVLKKSGSAEH